ncbi:hypothetical protein GLAREA_07243 [Glarea lozoyensis ATCC 20868]|uniref:Uncharacterized protein n=1 Tax=Glarea lozoyensis (strain ATCC 20868 / MF5171) TaxID=1116229 RepID=S3D941_GLAL2|nr:uncharacterized protein GLAREA_07243 [Glarea lozoyensis ATCC 20868]EPE34230.1 hypothetical protein GLAREA_07243 [Glarea lozoyensis ATCC 20868]
MAKTMDDLNLFFKLLQISSTPEDFRDRLEHMKHPLSIPLPRIHVIKTPYFKLRFKWRLNHDPKQVGLLDFRIRALRIDENYEVALCTKTASLGSCTEQLFQTITPSQYGGNPDETRDIQRYFFSNSLTWDGQIAGVFQCQEFREFRCHTIKGDKTDDQSDEPEEDGLCWSCSETTQVDETKFGDETNDPSDDLGEKGLCWSYSGADYIQATSISFPSRITIQIDVIGPFPEGEKSSVLVVKEEHATEHGSDDSDDSDDSDHNDNEGNSSQESTSSNDEDLVESDGDLEGTW